ncbi:MAG: DUF1284 domain-containing protein [Oligoflexia bacterium]|nr:DUF1284 domain-containing protein [Oligoflexia bacterium]
MLRFRPHHFLCTLGFEGKGYSPEFIRNFSRLAEELRSTPAGEEIQIEVTTISDSICQPCPDRRGEGCQSEIKIQTLDLAHARILGLSPGERLSWGEAKRRIAERMTPGAFENACAPCSWKELGVCRQALERLRGGKK